MPAGTCLLEPSRRGGHLWRFCPPTPWNHVRDYGVWLCDKAGINCEGFPKGAGRTGGKLPLTPHPKGGLLYPAIEPSTASTATAHVPQSIAFRLEANAAAGEITGLNLLYHAVNTPVTKRVRVPVERGQRVALDYALDCAEAVAGHSACRRGLDRQAIARACHRQCGENDSKQR